jgi:cell division septation protein DedD
VHPDATTTYTLYASGAKSDSRSVTVTVNEPAPAPTPSPVTAADSGDLSCRGVSVPPHGEVFFHLPGGKLRFYNLDPPTAWKLHIKTLPDGTQQLFMASQLNTVQTYCALRWERLYVVEVAAFSRQADADTFATVLKSRGYKFTQVTGADKLIHFYVGGASTKKDGEAARAKLVADGFNAHFVPAP